LALSNTKKQRNLIKSLILQQLYVNIYTILCYFVDFYPIANKTEKEELSKEL